jgi:hypothetical protein
MTDTRDYTGGCACGAVRYSVPGPTLVEIHCQCIDCQKRSGTGHGSYLIFDKRADMVLTGTVKTWSVPSDSGSLKSHAFCPECGTPVYVTLADRPANVCIHTGSLDEPARFAPQFVVYARRAQDWDSIDPALPTFQTMPEH